MSYCIVIKKNNQVEIYTAMCMQQLQPHLQNLVLNVIPTIEKQIPLKPPNKGHFGDGPVVTCREVVLFSEVFF